MDTRLEEPGSKRLKVEASDRPLNFAIVPDEFELQNVKKPKAPRDPMSHRIIEKRRRDRMNNCLADLSRLIPSNYIKQGQGRIEKTEIIEMAIKHIKTLQIQASYNGMDGDVLNTKEQRPCCSGRFYMGFKECQDEVMRFLVEIEGADAADHFCGRILDHLNNASQKFLSPTTVVGHEEKIEKGPILMDLETVPSSPFSLAPTDTSDPSQLIQENSLTPLSGVTSQARDRHLRTLLSTQDMGCNGSVSGSESCSSFLSLVPNITSSLCHPRRSEAAAISSSSGISSDIPAHSESETTCRTTRNRDNIYKFKHNITKRFSEEEKTTNQPSDTSSSSSREQEEDAAARSRRRSLKVKTRCHSTDSTPYPTSLSDISSNGNGSLKNEGRRHFTLSTHEDSEEFPPNPLPGFVLHPTGTHYVPISIHPSNIPDIFRSVNVSPGPLVFHPISIPVHFTGPYMSLRNITLTPLPAAFSAAEDSASSPEKADNQIKNKE